MCQLDWDVGMIWVSVSHWLLQSRKAEMPSVWKCHDWGHLYWNVTTCDISNVAEWIACWSEWMHVWMDVSAGLRWRDDLSFGFALIFAKQKGWNAFSVKMSRLVTFLLKCHHLWYFYCGWMNSMLRWMDSCVESCVSWIEMEGWSEYRFRIDCCKAERLKWFQCENVTTGDIFTEMSPLVIFLMWLNE